MTKPEEATNSALRLVCFLHLAYLSMLFMQDGVHNATSEHRMLLECVVDCQSMISHAANI